MKDVFSLGHTLKLVQGSNGYKYLPLALSSSAELETCRVLDPDKRSDKTAELDDELYSLDSRIFKREITPVISYGLPRSLLPKG